MHEAMDDQPDAADRRLRALGAVGLPEPSPVEALASRVVARQRRLRRTAVAAALILALVAGTSVIAVAQGGGGPKHVRAADTPTSTTPGTEETTTSESTQPSTTIHQAGAPSHTATTATACRNSYDPACGPFYWLTNPGANAALHLSVTYSPEHPRAGEQVTFHVVADDPDAPIDSHLTYQFGRTNHIADYAYPSCPRWQVKYGGWSPPARVHGHYEWNVVLTVPEHDWEWNWQFSTSSAYCEVNSLDDGSTGPRKGANPYASTGLESGRVDAVPAQTTDSSTSSSTSTSSP
jgi:hypothetical protein